ISMHNPYYCVCGCMKPGTASQEWYCYSEGSIVGSGCDCVIDDDIDVIVATDDYESHYIGKAGTDDDVTWWDLSTLGPLFSAASSVCIRFIGASQQSTGTFWFAVLKDDTDPPGDLLAPDASGGPPYEYELAVTDTFQLYEFELSINAANNTRGNWEHAYLYIR